MPSDLGWQGISHITRKQFHTFDLWLCHTNRMLGWHQPSQAFFWHDHCMTPQQALFMVSTRFQTNEGTSRLTYSAHRRQNIFFLSMPNLFCTSVLWSENSNRDRLVPRILGFFSFWGNSGPVSGRNLTFCEHCMNLANMSLTQMYTMGASPYESLW